MESITDVVKNMLLAGVGAAAFSVEKSSEIVDALVKKGEITVDQGKALNQELKHKAEEVKKDAEEKKEEPEKKEEKKDFTELVKGLSDEDLAKLKAALAEREDKKE